MIDLRQGDCLEVLKTFEENSVDSIVTDPPAGISFMGKEWDKDKGGRDNWIAWMQEIAGECIRVLKPGGHAIVWAIPRTSHWTATAWENAGFEVRERISHIFGSGFPKSLNVGKAIDRAAGAKRGVVGVGIGRTGKKSQPNGGSCYSDDNYEWPGKYEVTAPATEAAKQWEGWGTALKPAMEDYWLLRKPLSEKTIAENVLRWGVGGLNIDGCRVDFLNKTDEYHRKNKTPGNGIFGEFGHNRHSNPQGRWPANLIHDGSPEVVGLFPMTSSGNGVKNRDNQKAPENKMTYHKFPKRTGISYYPNDAGSAARYFACLPPDENDLADLPPVFYCSKASKVERNEGLDGFPEKHASHDGRQKHIENPYQRHENIQKNNHPTVKPIKLMRYLCRLITPPNGTVLDLFMGSGTTGVAAIKEGFSFIGIEKETDFFAISKKRIEYTENKPVDAQISLFSEDAKCLKKLLRCF